MTHHNRGEHRQLFEKLPPLEMLRQYRSNGGTATANRYLRGLAKGRLTKALRAAVFERDGMACRSCGADCRPTRTVAHRDGASFPVWDEPVQPPEIDHIIPVSQGGETRLDNLRVLCRRCNIVKADT